MARNGHPRVPRKIRGERKRLARLAQQKGIPAWERDLLNRRRKALDQVRREVTDKSVTINKYPTGVEFHNDLLKTSYEPIVQAALGSSADWQRFVAQNS